MNTTIPIYIAALLLVSLLFFGWRNSHSRAEFWKKEAEERLKLSRDMEFSMQRAIAASEYWKGSAITLTPLEEITNGEDNTSFTNPNADAE